MFFATVESPFAGTGVYSRQDDRAKCSSVGFIIQPDGSTVATHLLTRADGDADLITPFSTTDDVAVTAGQV